MSADSTGDDHTDIYGILRILRFLRATWRLSWPLTKLRRALRGPLELRKASISSHPWGFCRGQEAQAERRAVGTAGGEGARQVQPQAGSWQEDRATGVRAPWLNIRISFKHV